MTASTGIKRIAMWSGPRNISTALMRAWSSRADTMVCDEPLYAHYLSKTGLDHPGRNETLGSQSHDWQEVTRELAESVLESKSIYYQKLMAHHLLPEIDLGWTDSLCNCFLVRDPSEMIPSLAKHLGRFGVDETGLPQQARLFERLQQQSQQPPVLDSKDVLQAPEPMLRGLCDRLGVDFDPAMLTWEPGYRTTDGAWAPYWYAEVVKTTTFQPYRPKKERVPAHLADVYDQCMGYYESLYRWRLTP